MKSIFVAALGVSAMTVAKADMAFQCQTSQGEQIAVSFSEEQPRYPGIWVHDEFQTRFVKGAGYQTSVGVNNELRTYKFDFGSGKNLVLYAYVSYAVSDMPAVSGLLDQKPFNCLQSSVMIEYTMLDRIVNSR